MTWDRSKPWTAPARTLILYRTESGSWRFSIYNEGGIMDGHLAVLGDNATLEEAQSALLARVEESSGLNYAATWTTSKPDWWSANLTIT